MAISTIGTDALASAAVTSAKLASGAPSRSQLPAGTVLQVVQGDTTSVTTVSTTTPTASAITASITPSTTSNKILIRANVPAYWSSAAAGVGVLLYRNGSLVFTPSAVDGGPKYYYVYNSNTSGYTPVTFEFLDSPSSTSSLTYTIYVCGYNSAGPISVPYGGSATNAHGVITLMEIAA